MLKPASFVKFISIGENKLASETVFSYSWDM